MLAPAVEVVAPSRLHFGMFSFGDSAARQFGGAGVMIDRPGVKLRITTAECFTAAGPSAEKVRSIVERLADAWRVDSLPACRIEVVDAPPEHIGLGTGTQLALAVTAGLNAFRGGEPLDAPALARLSGRAARSAIGTHGFVHGGFLVEAGKLEGESISPLEQQIPLPAEWRFVLICPHGDRGLFGDAEQCAFRDLPPVPAEVSHQLRREVAEEMVPAARDRHFERFSRSVYRFGHQAGMCFAARQGGAFASGRIAGLVEAIREYGVKGTGQSSWGPTVFATLESAAAARRFVDSIGGQLEDRDSIVVAKAANSGARVIRGQSNS